MWKVIRILFFTEKMEFFDPVGNFASIIIFFLG